MTTETVDVRDTAHFVTREPRSSFATVLHELAKVHGHGTVTPFANVRELALLDDAAYPSAFSLICEVALLSDAAYPAVHYETDAHDVFYVSDTISSLTRAVRSVREVAQLDGRAVAAPTAKLHEVARLNDHIYWFGGGAALREVGYLDDHAYPHNAAKLREVARLDDHLYRRNRSRVTVHELALLSDAFDSEFTQGATLREVFYALDHTTLRVVWGGGDGAGLYETFYADDRAIPPPTGRAYTASILTFGMSQYANYPFLTQAGNYAAGQNLWRLDATDDYGKPVQAWVTTGKVDIGTSHGKRPTALYAAGSSNEPLVVVVTGDLNGRLASFEYTLDLRDQRDYRNNKTLLGKGFRSRYLQFKLQAPKYLGFRLLTAEVDLAVSPRRVG